MRVEFTMTGYNENGDLYDSSYCIPNDYSERDLLHKALDEFLDKIDNPKTGKSNPVFMLNICDIHQ